MNSFKAACQIHLLLTVLICMSASSWARNALPAKAATETEIHVTLLDRPCLLKGPFDEITLKAIHAIGPDQIPNIFYPVPQHSKEQIKNALEKIRSSKNLSSLLDHDSILDRYRDKQRKRLEAEIALLEGLETQQKTHTSALLLAAGNQFLSGPEHQNFINAVKKLDGNKKSAQNQKLVEQIFNIYDDGIERDPEEEFHRAIKKMKVEYTCSFE